MMTPEENAMGALESVLGVLIDAETEDYLDPGAAVRALEHAAATLAELTGLPVREAMRAAIGEVFGEEADAWNEARGRVIDRLAQRIEGPPPPLEGPLSGEP